MQVTLNGEAKALPEGVTILEMVTTLGLVPQAMVVEVNQKIFQHDDFPDVVIKEGDKVEIIQFVGGG